MNKPKNGHRPLPRPSPLSRTRLLAALALAILLASCASVGRSQNATARSDSAPPYPATSFMVFSDPHFYDPALGVSGRAWEEMASANSKVLADGPELVELFLAEALQERPDFVLVPGDLSKDGERASHERLASMLDSLEEAGIRVFVVPGNHDIANPNALSYPPEGKARACATVSAADFARIYAREGYAEAFSRDPASLSYAAELLPGFWLLGLDCAVYDDAVYGQALQDRDQPRPLRRDDGRIREASYAWIETVLNRAAIEGASVIAMEHHPILEHFDGMADERFGFLARDHGRVAQTLAKHDVRFIFSGHVHVNAVAEKSWGRLEAAELRHKYLIEIGTGSLVTWPCPIRRISFTAKGQLQVSTERVEALGSYEGRGLSFATEAKKTLERGIALGARSLFQTMGLTERDIASLTEAMVTSTLSYYAGLTRRPGFSTRPADTLDTKGMSVPGLAVGALFSYYMEGLWKQRLPKATLLLDDDNLRLPIAYPSTP